MTRNVQAVLGFLLAVVVAVLGVLMLRKRSTTAAAAASATQTTAGAPPAAGYTSGAAQEINAVAGLATALGGAWSSFFGTSSPGADPLAANL